MNWAKLIIGLIEASLWPVVTLILAGGALVYVRKELTSLFRRRIRAKYGDVEVLIDPDEAARRHPSRERR